MVNRIKRGSVIPRTEFKIKRGSNAKINEPIIGKGLLKNLLHKK